jgi:Domain of unknown function (DUF4114)/PEP-CTERM motif
MKNIFLTALCLTATLVGMTTQAQSARANSINWDGTQRQILSKSQTGFNDQPFQAYVQQEGVKLTGSTQFKLDANALKLKYDHNVSTYFINEGAGYRNQLGYMSRGATTQSGLLFKDISCAGADCVGSWGGNALKLGDGVNVGDIKGGSILDFKLRADGLNRGSNAYIFGTPQSENADGLQHVVAYGIKGTGYILLGFEDLYGDGTSGQGKFGERSDRDFNDTVFVLDVGKKNVDAFLGQDVPEPSIMLSLLGLSAAGVLKSRRRKGEEA